jgi:hypothetical protein
MKEFTTLRVNDGLSIRRISYCTRSGREFAEQFGTVVAEFPHKATEESQFVRLGAVNADGSRYIALTGFYNSPAFILKGEELI